MKRFSELGIKANVEALKGDKIKISRILNKEILVTGYKLVDSKYPPKNNTDYNKCLWLQITYNETEHVVFCSSKVLASVLLQTEESHFPFLTTIVMNGDAYNFT